MMNSPKGPKGPASARPPRAAVGRIPVPGEVIPMPVGKAPVPGSKPPMMGARRPMGYKNGGCVMSGRGGKYKGMK